MTNIKRTYLPLIFLGDSTVGKSSLTQRITSQDFIEGSSGIATVGKAIFETFFTFDDGRKVKIKIHDTAGQERFRSIAKQTIKSAEGVLLVYSINLRESFENLENWIRDIKNNKDIPIILIANKCDLEDERVITKEEGEKFAKEHQLEFFETSAKKDINVNESFSEICKKMYALHKNEFDVGENPLVIGANKRRGGGCCGRNKEDKA